MLKALEWTAMLAAAILIVSAVGIAYLSSPPAHNSNEQQTTTETENQKQIGAQHSLRGFIRFLFPDGIAVFTSVLALATILLGWIAIVQIGYLARAERISADSTKAAKDSADAAQKALIAANRPWITADALGERIYYDVNGVNFSIKYIVKNTGKSPATHIRINPQPIAPAIGIETSFDVRAQFANLIASEKRQTKNPFGFALFPDETVSQIVKVNIPQEELKRITQKVDFIAPTIVVSISYRMGFDSEVHQTGFIFDVKRSDQPRPASIEKNRAPSGIFPDEGDIPGQEIRLVRSILDGGYAD